MGLKYLNGKRWADVTREERYFCMHLYNRITEVGTSAFVRHLRDSYACDVDPDADWELAFEACFYRDLWCHRGKRGELFSPKRTFDLALLSDRAIIIIEAKAQQGFDDNQLSDFLRDCAQVAKETGVDRVLLLGLCSSRHRTSTSAAECFGGRLITWSNLAGYFGGDALLQRADDIYEQSTFSSFGRNNAGGYMTGEELVAAFRCGERFFVGRGKGGLRGSLFTQDVATGGWRTQKYETNRERAPNSNWFSLEDFVRTVGRAG